MLIAYLNEHGDAKDTQRLVEEAGRKAVVPATFRRKNKVAKLAGDVGPPEHCRVIVEGCPRTWRRRYSCQQCGAPSHRRIDRSYFRRGMGADVQGQRPNVLADQSSSSAYEGRERHHQHSVDQCRYS